MGFTEFERSQFLESCRGAEKIQTILENEYPDDILDFIQSEGHIKRARDYCIFNKRPIPNKPEQIIVTYLLNADMFLDKILTSWADFLTPPVSQ